MATTYDARPLPVGGQRVPAGMEDHQDWRTLPEQEVVVVPSETYGGEYVAKEKLRAALNELKKTVSALMVTLAAIENYKAMLDSAENDKNVRVQKSLTTEEQKKQKYLLEIESRNASFADGSQWQLLIQRLQTDSNRQLTKEEFAILQDFVKLHTSAMFREQNNLLQQLKEIKKQHAAANK